MTALKKQDSLEKILADSLSLIRELSCKQSFLVEESHIKKVIPKKAQTKSQPESSFPSRALPSQPKALPPPSQIEVKPESPLQEELKPVLAKEMGPQPLAFEELSGKLSRLFPHFAVHDHPLDDKIASYKARPSYLRALQAEVILLSFKESKESDLFLQNIQKALATYNISTLFLPIKSVEETKQFLEQAQAKVMLASSLILKEPKFLSLIKELPASQQRFILDSHLLLLEPFEKYFADKNLKKSLWHTLCKILMENPMPASS